MNTEEHYYLRFKGQYIMTGSYELSYLLEFIPHLNVSITLIKQTHMLRKCQTSQIFLKCASLLLF